MNTYKDEKQLGFIQVQVTKNTTKSNFGKQNDIALITISAGVGWLLA